MSYQYVQYLTVYPLIEGDCAFITIHLHPFGSGRRVIINGLENITIITNPYFRKDLELREIEKDNKQDVFTSDGNRFKCLIQIDTRRECNNPVYFSYRPNEISRK